MTHTPGPWAVHFDETGGYDCMSGSYAILCGEKWKEVAEVDQNQYGQKSCDWDFRSQEAEANARLIAAAPELLEALRVILDSVDAHKVRLDIYELELARAAIAKATGGSP